MSVFYSIDWIYSYQQTKCLGIIFHLKLNKIYNVFTISHANNIYRASTKSRRSRNTIISIKSPAGDLITGNKEIGKEAQRYYTDLFESTNPGDMSSILDSVTRVVTPDMNALLTPEITDDEVKKSVFSIGSHHLDPMDSLRFFIKHIGILWDLR